ncbi:unnamed protein product, partial [Allacma fusca]
VTQVE